MACGAGTYDNGRAVCVPSSTSDCPLVDAKASMMQPEDWNTAFFGNESSMQPFADGSGTLLWVRPAASEINEKILPINQVQVAFYGNRRVDCFSSDSKVDQGSWSGKGDSYDYKLEHPPTCKNVDKRWVNLDVIDEEDFLWDTFGTLDECTSCVYCDVRYFLTPTCIKFGALILCIAFCIAVSNLHRTTLNQE